MAFLASMIPYSDIPIFCFTPTSTKAINDSVGNLNN